MSDSLTMDLSQFADLKAALKALPDDLRGDVVSEAIQPGAQLVLEAARAGVPRRAGGLAASLFTEESAKGPEGAEWDVGTARQGGFMGLWVELGTGPHEEHGGSYVHPGAVARPFLRPALDANQEEVVHLMGEALGAALERAHA